MLPRLKKKILNHHDFWNMYKTYSIYFYFVHKTKLDDWFSKKWHFKFKYYLSTNIRSISHPPQNDAEQRFPLNMISITIHTFELVSKFKFPAESDLLIFLKKFLAEVLKVFLIEMYKI